MDPTPTPKQREKLEAWLRYYNDLGLSVFYRDRTRVAEPAVKLERPVEAALGGDSQRLVSQPVEKSQPHAAPMNAPVKVMAMPLPQRPVLAGISETTLFEAIDRVDNDTLERIREDLGDCTRCRLHKQRNKLVFGQGNPRAELVFVGEGPGHDEDMQGLAFVGRAGKLLTQMIEAMGLRRDDVYICNVVKCRPPENRKPEDDEIATCSPYLYRQLDVIGSKAIVCLGATAAQALLKTKDSISRYRGQWFDFRGTKLLVTYHPAYLLRNPNAKGEVWKDLQKVMAHLGLAPPRKPAR
jgi:uracil-DNA glycosylase